MINITGIGIGKDIFFELLEKQDFPIQKVMYHEINDVVGKTIVVYDGMMFDEAINLNKSIGECLYIFMTPKNIFMIGDSLGIPSDDYVCPTCIVNRVKNDLFTLKLYDDLFSRTDYKTIDMCFRDEYKHFASILVEQFENLEGVFLEYNLLTSLYQVYYPEGLTNCSKCDNNDYSQANLIKEIQSIDDEV